MEGHENHLEVLISFFDKEYSRLNLKKDYCDRSVLKVEFNSMPNLKVGVLWINLL